MLSTPPTLPEKERRHLPVVSESITLLTQREDRPGIPPSGLLDMMMLRCEKRARFEQVGTTFIFNPKP